MSRLTQVRFDISRELITVFIINLLYTKYSIRTSAQFSTLTTLILSVANETTDQYVDFLGTIFSRRNNKYHLDSSLLFKLSKEYEKYIVNQDSALSALTQTITKSIVPRPLEISQTFVSDSLVPPTENSSRRIHDEICRKDCCSTQNRSSIRERRRVNASK